MTEMQAFLLLLMRNGPDGVLYIAGHVHLPDTVEVGKRRTALTDPRKGEDLRSVTRKLERIVDRGWATCSKVSWWRITDDGREALETDAAKRVIQVMVDRYDARQRLWNLEREQERGQ